MWAILTDPEKSGGRWTPEEFFATGVSDVRDLMQRAERFGFPRGRRCALDFGCGIGRLTQPLADYFEKAYGVDISPEMLEQARKYNPKGSRCEYRWNAGTRLEGFADGSVDLVYSKLTLQHVRPRDVKAYLREFLRVLAPGGLLMFQLPGRPVQPYSRILDRWRFRAARARNLTRNSPLMYMNGIDCAEVKALLTRHGGNVIEVEENTDAGPEFRSYAYAVARPPAPGQR